MSQIHPSSIIDPNAKIGKDVKIGPFCIVGPNVEIGDGCVLHSHVVIDGHTTIGQNNQFFHFCSIGAAPQDNSYKGEPTKTVIGDGNTFREGVTVHRATTKENYVTKIGDNNLLMAYVHIAHDDVIGNKCTLVNSCNLAGHVKIGDRVIIGGSTSIAQFVTLGRGAYIGGASGIDKDIPPFCTAYGNRVKIRGINIIGMRRQGYDRQTISEVVDFLRNMEASGLNPRSFIDHEEHMAEFKHNSIVQEMVEHIKTTEIGIATFAE